MAIVARRLARVRDDAAEFHDPVVDFITSPSLHFVVSGSSAFVPLCHLLPPATGISTIIIVVIIDKADLEVIACFGSCACGGGGGQIQILTVEEHGCNESCPEG